MKTPEKLAYDKTLNRLINELQRIRANLLEAEVQFGQLIESAEPSWRESARNLVHYLALRRFEEALAGWTYECLLRSVFQLYFTDMFLRKF